MMMVMRLSGLLSVSSLVVIGLQSALAKRLDVIDLPLGFSPEGITNGEEWTAFVGSLINGDIWMGDLSTGEGVVMELSAPGPAVGLDHDRRTGNLFVAGGANGTARVYSEDFDLVANLALVTDGEATFINDVIVTKTAAYFTDSPRSQIYKVSLNEVTGALEYSSEDGSTPVSTITLSDNYNATEGTFNLNGIEATDDGSTLIIVNMVTQKLFAVDPETGDATQIDLGGELLPGTHSDGLVLRKNTLWIVDNTLEQITEVSLSTDLSCGIISPRVLTNDDFDRPTTAMRKGNSLYAVNAKFDVDVGDRNTTAYEIVRVDRDSGGLTCNTAV